MRLAPAFDRHSRWPDLRTATDVLIGRGVLPQEQVADFVEQREGACLGDEGRIDGDERGGVVPQRETAYGVGAKLKQEDKDARAFNCLAPAAERGAGSGPLGLAG